MFVKVRKSKASPCSKKGIDNYKHSNWCECKKTRDESPIFETHESLGVINHKQKNPTSKFNGCT